MKKWVVLALVFGGGVFLYLNLGDFITKTVEKIASNALGVAVDIGSINVSLSDKKVTVDHVAIANPPGYSKPHAITTNAIMIGLNTASKELIDFKDIRVKGSEVYLEVNEKGMNLMDLKKLASQKKQKESAGSEQIRVIVQHMVIDATKVHPSVSFLKRDIGAITVPPMTFSNIGKGSGINAGDAVTQIVSRYVTAIEKTAREQGVLGDVPLMDEIGKTIDDTAKGLKNLF